MKREEKEGRKDKKRRRKREARGYFLPLLTVCTRLFPPLSHPTETVITKLLDWTAAEARFNAAQ
jgi:hypothetical protein